MATQFHGELPPHSLSMPKYPMEAAVQENIVMVGFQADAESPVTATQQVRGKPSPRPHYTETPNKPSRVPVQEHGVELGSDVEAAFPVPRRTFSAWPAPLEDAINPFPATLEAATDVFNDEEETRETIEPAGPKAQEKVLRYHLSYSRDLILKIAAAVAFLLLTYVPKMKHLLDKKLIHSFSVGLLLRWGVATQAQFITGSELYPEALKALRHGAANVHVLIILSTNAAYAYSVYSSLRAACSKDFKGTDFFGTSSMLITFIQLWKSLKVIGRTRNENGLSHINATQVELDSAVLQIAPSVQMTNAPTQQLINLISKHFVPLVIIIISFSTWFAWFLVGMLRGYPESWEPSSMSSFELALQFGISIMLIACFCALELATPAAVMVAIGIAAYQGLLIKCSQALETTHKANFFIFNKTVTLTKPVVVSTKLLKDMDPREVCVLITATEVKSEHPFAEAIVKHAKEIIDDNENLVWPEARDFISIIGCGVKATVWNKEIIVGNKRLMLEQNITIPPDAERELLEAKGRGQTGILVSIDREVVGVLVISDEVKPGAREVITTLKSMNIRTIMVTGDNRRTAESIAKEIGIEIVVAEATPEDRAEKVRELQALGYTVAMVGQDINDLPALKAADVGIAIGADANEVADVILKKLEDMITAIDLSRKAFPFIRLNRLWAFVYTLLAIPIAAGGLIPLTGFRSLPLLSAAAMASSYFSVLFSFHMLKKYKKPRNLDIRELREITTE